MQPTLYDIYKGQGKALPSTAEARFADPQFAAAAQQAGITRDQYNVSGGNAALNTKIASLYGKAPTVPQPTQTAPTAPISAPTVAYTPVEQNNLNASSMSDIYGMADYNKANEDYLSYATDPTGYLQKQGISQSDFKSKALAEMQAQIDSTNALYANKLAESKRLGGNLLGQTGAIQARRGLLGSDFGTAQTQDVVQKNQAVYDSVEQERLAAINDIMSKAEQASTTRFAEARAAAEGGLKARIEYLKGKQEQAKSGATEAANLLVSKGLDISKVSPAELDQIASGYGTSKKAIEAAMASLAYASTQEENKRKQDIEDALAKKGIETISEGTSGYRYNPSTGKYELVASKAKTYAPSTTASTGTTSGVSGQTSEQIMSTLSGDAKAYINAIQRGDTTLTEALTKIGASKAGLALKNEIIRGMDALSGGATGTKLIAAPEAATFANLVKNIEKIDTTMYGQIDTPGGFLSNIFNPTSSAYMQNLLDNLSLEKREMLKGSGAISDFESKMLANSVSILQRKNISETDAAAALKNIKDVLNTKLEAYNKQTNQPGGAPEITTAPDGTLIEFVD